MTTLSERQTAVLLILADRRGALTTTELRDLVNAGDADEETPDLRRNFNTQQIGAVCKQLASKGFATNADTRVGTNQWVATDAGRERADSTRGLIS